MLSAQLHLQNSDHYFSLIRPLLLVISQAGLDISKITLLTDIVTSSADLFLSIASLPDQTYLLLIVAPLPNKTAVKAAKPSESSVAVSVAVRWVAVFFFADLSSCFSFILVSLCPYIPDATPSLVSSSAPSRGPRGTFHREYRRRSHGESCGALGMALLCTPSLGSVGTSPGVPSNI